MANDKDFVVAGAVEVGKDTKVTLGTVTSNNIDLATGNYFADTPSGTSTYTISNAGDVQSFQLEVTGGTEEVAQNFSTTLYTGNNDNGGNTQTITNGIDLASDGGLVWIKDRSGSSNHILVDTERGVNNALRSNSTSANTSYTGSNSVVDAFNSDGFDVGEGSQVNYLNNNFVSWTFKKEPSFFDVVTYTGDGVAGREISHNLGSVPGCIMIKQTTGTNNWIVYHRGANGGINPEQYNLYLNLTNAQEDFILFDDTASTATNFTVGGYASVNGSGHNYVAYLFAHDDAADGLIQCGSYTGNGSTDGPEISLGWQPQWILTKYSSRISGGGAGNWSIIDNSRGFTPDGSDAYLRPNESAAEATATLISPTSTGFKLNTTSGDYNQNDATYIYIAIRAASEPDITWPSSIEWAGGIAPSAPATGETDVYTLVTDDGGTSYVGVKTADNLS